MIYIVSLYPRPFVTVFSCAANDVFGVTVDCSGVTPNTSLQCSFKNGPLHSCK